MYVRKLIVFLFLLSFASSLSQTTVWLSIFPVCERDRYDILKIMVYDGDIEHPENISTVYRSYGMPGLTKISQMFLLDFVFTKEDADNLKKRSSSLKVAALHSCVYDPISQHSTLIWSKEYLLPQIDLNKAINKIAAPHLLLAEKRSSIPSFAEHF